MGLPTTAGGDINQQVAMEQAKQELEALTDMYSRWEFIFHYNSIFTRMQDQCFRKCVSSYSESDLSKGESVCVERCVLKYMDVHKKVAERMRGLNG